MREKWATIAVVGAVCIGLLCYLVVYTVPVDKVAVHKRFSKVIRIVKPSLGTEGEEEELAKLRQKYAQAGDPVEVVGKAGLYFKLPWPFDKVELYDQRVRYVDGPLAQVQLADQYQLIPRVYATWKITDPVDFQKSLKGDEDRAAQTLKDIIGNETGNVFGASQLHDVVNADKSQLKFDEIEQRILEGVRARLEGRDKPYGLKVTSLGITWVALPQETTDAVFERMTAERMRLAEELKAQGETIKQSKISEAEARKAEILAKAEADAKNIRASAETLAASYFDIFARNPELAEFLRGLEAFENIARTAAANGEPLTLVLSTATWPFNLLAGEPALQGLPPAGGALPAVLANPTGSGSAQTSNPGD